MKKYSTLSTDFVVFVSSGSKTSVGLFAEHHPKGGLKDVEIC